MIDAEGNLIGGERSIRAEHEERKQFAMAVKSQADLKNIADAIATALGMPFAADPGMLITALRSLIDARIKENKMQ